MTARRWPILDLDEGATEGQIRRAYAARLREQGPDADVASFQALRTEFEAALEAVRSGSQVAVSTATADRRTAGRAPEISGSRAGEASRSRTGDELPPPPPPPPDTAARVIAEIRQLLSDGDLPAACERYDRARSSSEIGLVHEAPIELELARTWLGNATLDTATLIEIVRRYRWDDAVSPFPLSREILARLKTLTVPRPEPGARFIGQWNWGAFCLTPFWLIAHGLRRRGIRVLVMSAVLIFVPLGFLGVLWIAVDGGRTGNALAVKHRRFRDDDDFVAVQNAWRNRGWALIGGMTAFFIAVIWAVVAAR